jgi:hypothetical protein
MMNSIRFENETEFNEWVENHLTDLPVIGRDVESPSNYPCVMVYDFLENPYTETYDEEVEFDELIEEGHYSDEIEKFIYHFVDLMDFE